MHVLSKVQPITESNGEWVGYLFFLLIVLLAVAGLSYLIYGLVLKVMEKKISPLQEDIKAIKEHIEEIKNQLNK